MGGYRDSPSVRVLMGLMRSRGVGHTQATIDAAKASGATVVCADERMAQRMRDAGVEHVITLETPMKLLGTDRPMLFDNHAVLRLIDDANRLALRNEELETVVEAITNLAQRARRHAPDYWEGRPPP